MYLVQGPAPELKTSSWMQARPVSKVTAFHAIKAWFQVAINTWIQSSRLSGYITGFQSSVLRFRAQVSINASFIFVSGFEVDNCSQVLAPKKKHQIKTWPKPQDSTVREHVASWVPPLDNSCGLIHTSPVLKKVADKA